MSHIMIVEHDERRLIAAIKKDIERANKATLEVEGAEISAGQGLAKLKEKKPQGISWQQYLDDCFGAGVIHQATADRYIRRASPEKKPKDIKRPAKPVLEPTVENIEEFKPAPQADPKGAFLSNCATAQQAARYDGPFDQKVLEAAEQAALAWNKVAASIRLMVDTALRAPEEYDPGPIPEFLRRAPKAAAS